MIDEREGNGIQNGLVSNFSLKQANRGGWLGKNGIYDSILPGFRLLFFRVLPLRSPINFRDISDIGDRRKKAFDSRPSQLDSVFITEAARDIASAYLLRRKRRERLNDSFSFPFFSLSLPFPPSNESRRSRVAEERWK